MITKENRNYLNNLILFFRFFLMVIGFLCLFDLIWHIDMDLKIIGWLLIIDFIIDCIRWWYIKFEMEG